MWTLMRPEHNFIRFEHAFSRRNSVRYLHSHERLEHFHNAHKLMSILDSASRDSFSLNCFRIPVYSSALSVHCSCLVSMPIAHCIHSDKICLFNNRCIDCLCYSNAHWVISVPTNMLCYTNQGWMIRDSCHCERYFLMKGSSK